jgi:enamine deaminase RidA (YjgF/YER057c/UK114 family)
MNRIINKGGLSIEFLVAHGKATFSAHIVARQSTFVSAGDIEAQIRQTLENLDFKPKGSV